MRFAPFLFALALAACGQPSGSTTATSETTATLAGANSAGPAVWFICDGIDAPTVLVFSGGPPATNASMVAYDKGARADAAAPVEYTLGDSEGAAGSVYTPLQLNGQDAGNVRQINPGMLETPGAAYTTPYSSVTLGDRHISCRWMPRTRLMGFSDRRSFVINEDADGDLIYTTYDYVRGASQPIDTSDGGRTNTFSLEVRGGEEQVSPQGSVFTFNNNGYRYVVTAQGGATQAQVFHGAQLVQTEPLIAAVLGAAGQNQN